MNECIINECLTKTFFLIVLFVCINKKLNNAAEIARVDGGLRTLQNGNIQVTALNLKSTTVHNKKRHRPVAICHLQTCYNLLILSTIDVQQVF